MAPTSGRRTVQYRPASSIEGRLAACRTAGDESDFVPVDDCPLRPPLTFADPDTLAMAQPAAGPPRLDRRTHDIVARSRCRTPGLPAGPAPTALVIASWQAVRELMGRPWRTPVGVVTAEQAYRFPVLTHWQFTVDGDPSF